MDWTPELLIIIDSFEHSSNLEDFAKCWGDRTKPLHSKQATQVKVVRTWFGVRLEKRR